MTVVRLWFGVAFVAHLSLLVLCDDEPGTTLASSDTETKSTPSFETTNTSAASKKVKCHKSPTTCGPNEIQDNCPANCESDYCPTSNSSDSSLCTTPEVCPPAVCKCRFNYRRALNGTCIPTRSCPPFDCSSKPNEEFVSCPPLCPTDDCSQASPSGECPPLFGNIGIVLPCSPKCRCIKGYWRLNGTCVPYGQCPGVCPENERYSECIQGECRALDCTQIGLSIPCPRVRPEFCRKGCVCEEGYLRNEDGTCVKEEQCEDTTCPKHEEYVPCIQGVCRAMNCSEKDEEASCPEVMDEDCDSGCVCKEIFLRNENGDCVPEDTCDEETCPPNEQLSKCSQAECRALDCTERGKPIPCPSILEGSCIKECVCKAGYLRAENGTCVLEEQCPPPTCVENEVLQNCSQYCTSDYCPYSADQEQDCYPPSPSETCIPMCKCRFNYRRSDNGTCIPTRSCPPFDCSDRPNEEYTPCPPICPSDACGKPRLTGHCPFRIGIVLNCQPKCQCKDGYGRVNGTCVPFEECPDLCPANEEYSPCTQKTCRPQTCSERNSIMEKCSKCNDVSCQRGCVCKENHFRNDKGICVPLEECEDND